MYEYPQAEGDPYYPVPRPENALLYQKYKQLAEQTPNVHFVGRLATYKCYNMDQVVAQALKTYNTIIESYDLMEREVGNSLPLLEPATSASTVELPAAKVSRNGVTHKR